MKRGAGIGWRAAALIVVNLMTLAMTAPAAAQVDGGEEIETLRLLEQRRPSAAAAAAALELGGAWLVRGAWLPAAELLQEAAELAATFEQEEVLSAARNRLAAVERLRLRPAADRPRWRSARVLTLARIEIDRPIGVAAREDGELIVVDERRDLVIRVSLADATERASGVRRVQRALWGPAGEVVVLLKDESAAELGGASWPWPPAGLRAPLDVARDAAGRWLGLTASGVERVAGDGSNREALELEGFRPAIALDTDPLGNLYLLEEEARRVVVFDRDGRRVDVVGPTLPGGLELRRPHDLAVDDRGRLFIADRRVGVVILE